MMYNEKPYRSTLAEYTQTGFHAVEEKEALKILQEKRGTVGAVYSWHEGYPSGTTVRYAVCLNETPDGVGHPSRGWQSDCKTVTALVARRAENKAKGRAVPELDWFVRLPT